jgi:hypothetical protein
MNWLQGKKTYIAAAILVALGVYLAWTGNAPMAVMVFGMALSAFGIRQNQQRNAEMAARDTALLKKLALKQALTDEEKAQLVADGVVVVGSLMEQPSK